MKTTTDAVQREYEALYLNRRALSADARRALRRVAGVPVADVLDEAFLTLWRDIIGGTVGGPLAEHVRNYVSRAAWKLARRALRTDAHERPVGLAVPEEAVLNGYRETTPERARFAAAFDDAVRSLTPKQREAFILTQLRGLTQREAAATLGLSQQAVQQRVDGATDFIRTALIEEDAL